MKIFCRNANKTVGNLINLFKIEYWENNQKTISDARKDKLKCYLSKPILIYSKIVYKLRACLF